jgi:hypothetical protein
MFAGGWCGFDDLAGSFDAQDRAGAVLEARTEGMRLLGTTA